MAYISTLHVSFCKNTLFDRLLVVNLQRFRSKMLFLFSSLRCSKIENVGGTRGIYTYTNVTFSHCISELMLNYRYVVYDTIYLYFTYKIEQQQLNHPREGPGCAQYRGGSSPGLRPTYCNHK